MSLINLDPEVLDVIRYMIEFVKNSDRFYDVSDVVELVAGEVEENHPGSTVDRNTIRDYLEGLFYNTSK